VTLMNVTIYTQAGVLVTILNGSWTTTLNTTTATFTYTPTAAGAFYF